MSIPERIFRLSKAYLHQVRDRIDNELSDAERELNTSVGGSAVASRPDDLDTTLARRSAQSESDAEAMMRRAEERIAAARRDLEGRTELRGSSATEPNGTTTGAVKAASTTSATKAAADAMTIRNADPNASDFRVLGVEVGSDLPTVTSAYEKLARRCDPRRFPDNSTEQKEAERILTRVNASYEALRKRLDPTTNRFGKLEFE